MKFTIEVEMAPRWVPHFITMLKYMQYLGGVGSSRNVTFFADGDGDFRPKFKFKRSWFRSVPVASVKPVIDTNGHRKYDAG
jgi:hypothetical protein